MQGENKAIDIADTTLGWWKAQYKVNVSSDKNVYLLCEEIQDYDECVDFYRDGNTFKTSWRWFWKIDDVGDCGIKANTFQHLHCIPFSFAFKNEHPNCFSLSLFLLSVFLFLDECEFSVWRSESYAGHVVAELNNKGSRKKVTSEDQDCDTSEIEKRFNFNPRGWGDLRQMMRVYNGVRHSLPLPLPLHIFFCIQLLPNPFSTSSPFLVEILSYSLNIL